MPRKGNPTFAIIGDGECELWYFQMMKRNERNLRIDLKPELPQRKRLSEQFAQVIQYSTAYDKVFWIVDLDTITSESRKAIKGQKNPRHEFKLYYLAIQKKHKNVTVIVNNPCLEFWILLHFEATTRYFDQCDGATRQLQKHLRDYQKTAKYYTRKDNDIYKVLRPEIQTAIQNAKKLEPFNGDNHSVAITQMHLIFEAPEIKQVLGIK